MTRQFKKLLVVLLIFSINITGCGLWETKGDEEEKYAIVVNTVDTLKDDTYYIKHGDEFYEIPQGDASFGDVVENDTELNSYINDFNPKTPMDNPYRNIFYQKDKTELLIPTMYKDDKLVYKTSQNIVDKFAWERFLDGGYTLGIRNLHMSDHDTIDFTNFQTDIATENKELREVFPVTSEESSSKLNTMTINAIDGVSVMPSQVSGNGGYLKDVNTAKEVTVDYYNGTNLIRIPQKADYRIFYGFENYWTTGFEFSTDGYALINVGEWLKSGYYKVNTSGMFRYIDQPSNSVNPSTVSYSDAFFNIVQDDTGEYVPLFVLNEDETRYLYTEAEISAELERRRLKEQQENEKGKSAVTGSSVTSDDFQNYDGAIY